MLKLKKAEQIKLGMKELSRLKLNKIITKRLTLKLRHQEQLLKLLKKDPLLYKIKLSTKNYLNNWLMQEQDLKIN